MSHIQKKKRKKNIIVNIEKLGNIDLFKKKNVFIYKLVFMDNSH